MTRYLLMLLVWSYSQSTNAQHYNFSYNSRASGLPFTKVNAMMQSQSGYMWFATNNGLYRFNGYDYKRYNNTLDNTGKIQYNQVMSIREIKEGIFWIGTGNGLCSFEERTENFSVIIPLFENNFETIIDLAVAPDSSVWLAAVNGGVYHLTQNGKLIRHFYIQGERSRNRSNELSGIMCSPDGTTWFNTLYGIYRIDKNADELKPVKTNSERDVPFSFVSTPKINPLNRNEILFASVYAGIISLNTNSGNWSVIFSGQEKELNHQEVVIHDFDFYNDSNLLIATSAGLLQYNMRTKSIMAEPINENNSRSLKYAPEKIAFDFQGNIWLSHDIGYSLMSSGKQFIKTISAPKGEYLSAITENGNRTRYYCSYLNKDSKIINRIYVQRQNQLPELLAEFDGVSFLRFIDNLNDEELIAGGYGKLMIVNKKNGHLTNVKNNTQNGNPLTQMTLMEGLKINDEKYFIATFNIGLLELDIKTKTITAYKCDSTSLDSFYDNSSATSITQGDASHIWCLGNLGELSRFNIQTKKVERYNYPGQNPLNLTPLYVQKIVKSLGNYLWISSYYDGIKKLNPLQPDWKNNIQSVGTLSGLESNHYFGLCNDQQGNIWALSDEKLFRFNNTNGTAEIVDVANGLPTFEQFFFLKSPGWQTIYITPASVNADIYYFNPSEFNQSNDSVKTVIENFEILNSNKQKVVQPDENNKIELQHNENNFMIKFAALDFSNEDKNNFYFQLQGVDALETKASRQRQVSYVNVPPGHYLFLIKVKDSMSGRLKGIRQINIEIIPAYYQTMWFKISCAVLIIGLIAWFYAFVSSQKLRLKLKEVQREKDLQEIRSKISRDLHDDIGSTLSSINMLSSKVTSIAHSDPQLASDLSADINNSSQRMLENMNDIIWSIKPADDTMEQIMIRMREFASSVLDAKDINYKIDFPESLNAIALPLHCKKNIFLIFKEAVNNLSKYSEATFAELFVTSENGKIIFTIKDNGKGFDEKNVKEGNGLQNMRMRAKQIHAELKMESSPQSGTQIKLTVSLS